MEPPETDSRNTNPNLSLSSRYRLILQLKKQFWTSRLRDHPSSSFSTGHPASPFAGPRKMLIHLARREWRQYAVLRREFDTFFVISFIRILFA